MDPEELIDPRPDDDAPLALWRNRIVLRCMTTERVQCPQSMG
jgi:hypothetical protein